MVLTYMSTPVEPPVIPVSILSNRGNGSDNSESILLKNRSRSQSSLIEAMVLTMTHIIIAANPEKSQSSLIEAMVLTQMLFLHPYEFQGLNPL